MRSNPPRVCRQVPCHDRQGGVQSGESGFALLLVFMMSAVIAITLYMEVPRVSFESQRAKEQLLIERGEQYKRAIQLFVKKMSRYPGTIEELEKTNNLRFLRKRFVDPMTGKSEWRLIHVGPGGVFTDSKVQKPKTEEKGKEANRNTFIGEATPIGGDPNQGQPQQNMAMRRRASEGGAGPEQDPALAGQQPGVPSSGIPPDPNQPQQQPGVAGSFNPNQPFDPANPNQAYPNQALTPINPTPISPTPISLIRCRSGECK